MYLFVCVSCCSTSIVYYACLGMSLVCLVVDMCCVDLVNKGNEVIYGAIGIVGPCTNESGIVLELAPVLCIHGWMNE